MDRDLKQILLSTNSQHLEASNSLRYFKIFPDNNQGIEEQLSYSSITVVNSSASFQIGHSVDL